MSEGLANYLKGIQGAVRIGLLIGLGFAAVGAAAAVVTVLLTGSFTFEHRHGTASWLALLPLEIAGGAVAGLIAGALLPLARHRFLAPLVGIVAGFPYFAALTVALVGEFSWFVAGGTSLLLGGGVGLIYHRIFSEEGMAEV